MTMLTHARTPHDLRGYDAQATGASIGAPHLAMIGRFARFVLTLAGFVIAVTAVASLKLAIYLPIYVPRFFH
jgi:hypothetical protein